MTWIGRLLNKRRVEADLRKELEDHLQRQRDDYLQAGLSDEEARRQVRLRFGGVEQIGEACRDVKGTRWLESIFEDVRFSQRVLRKSPGFTIAAVLTLALGIGANTAIFRLLDAVRLRTLPVKDPQQLAILQLADGTGTRGSQATPYPALTNPIWERFRDTQQSFSGVLAWGNNDFNISPSGETRLAHGLFVSGDFFKVLGVQPLMGRVFGAAEDQRGCGVPGAVVSYAFWQRELGGNASVIGRKLTLNFQKVEIVGVTPAAFSGLEIGRSFDVAVPLCSQAVLWNEANWLNEGTVWWLTVMGRLKQGETREQTNVQLNAASPALFRATLPSNYPAENVKDYLKFKLKAVPAGGGVSFLRDQYGDSLLLLLATTGLVLRIACANLANLLLARASARTREFAIRLAIGATRGRLIQQLITEVLLLTACGVATGLFLSGALSRFLIALLSGQGETLFLDLRPDWRMLGFTIMVAGLTSIAFGLAPAFQSTRAEAAEAMKTSGRSVSSSSEQLGLRRLLVIAQISLSLVLLVGALLFSGSLRNLLEVDAGFERNGVLIADLDLSRLHFPVARRIAFKRDLLGRIRAVPGVISAAEVTILPLSGDGTSNTVWKDEAGTNAKSEALFNWLGPGYLRTMGITLLAGRDFDDHDTASSPRVAIVNQSFARKLGLGDSPVGQRFRREATPTEPETVFEIAGLVNDTKYHNLREEFRPVAFLSVAQNTQPDPFEQIAIRSSIGVTGVTSGIRITIERVNRSIGLDFQSFDNTVRDGLIRERLMATLSGFFGALAALIASVGLYGVMSYIVVRRTNEIGVQHRAGGGPRQHCCTNSQAGVWATGAGNRPWVVPRIRLDRNGPLDAIWFEAARSANADLRGSTAGKHHARSKLLARAPSRSTGTYDRASRRIMPTVLAARAASSSDRLVSIMKMAILRILCAVGLAASGALAQDVIPLYAGTAPGSAEESYQEKQYFSKVWNTEVVTNVTKPTLTVYKPAAGASNGTAVVICPGGGFMALSINSEGIDVAKWLTARGVTAFVLRYRLAHTGEDATQEFMALFADRKKFEETTAKVIPLSIADGLAAVIYVRKHAADWGISADRVGIVGFSAGGTVTAGTGLHYAPEGRPAFVAPIYAAAAGFKDDPVPADAPPMFLAAATDDQLGLAMDSVNLYEKWTGAHKSAELHMYAKGGHGFGMRKQGFPSDHWIDRFGDWLDSQGWLKR